jgi:hypothetical protein
VVGHAARFSWSSPVTKFGPMKGWHKYGGVRFRGVLFGPGAGLVWLLSEVWEAISVSVPACACSDIELPQLQMGFLKCAHQTVPHSFHVLLQVHWHSSIVLLGNWHVFNLLLRWPFNKLCSEFFLYREGYWCKALVGNGWQGWTIFSFQISTRRFQLDRIS